MLQLTFKENNQKGRKFVFMTDWQFTACYVSRCWWQDRSGVPVLRTCWVPQNATHLFQYVSGFSTWRLLCSLQPLVSAWAVLELSWELAFLTSTQVILDKCITKQRHYFADKSQYSQSCGFSGSQVRMWELDHKEGWTPRNCCFRTVVWRRLLRVPWTAKRSN